MSKKPADAASGDVSNVVPLLRRAPVVAPTGTPIEHWIKHFRGWKEMHDRWTALEELGARLFCATPKEEVGLLREAAALFPRVADPELERQADNAACAVREVIAALLHNRTVPTEWYGDE